MYSGEVYDLVAMKTDNLFNFSWYWASQKPTMCKLCKACFQSKVQKTFPHLVYTENRLIQVFELSYSGETDFETVSKSKLNRFTRGCHFMLNLKCLLLIFILKTIFCSASFYFTISFIFLRKNKRVFCDNRNPRIEIKMGAQSNNTSKKASRRQRNEFILIRCLWFMNAISILIGRFIRII